jgi:membrane protein YdbS with pleckstrin-like domain
MVQDGDVIKVYYIPDYTQTCSVSYAVEYYIDDAAVPFASYTTSVDVWINDFCVEVNAIDVTNLPIGYKLCSISPALPAIVRDGEIIEVHYIPDYTQSKTISYTIQYYLYDIQNGNVLSDVETVTESVWINDSNMLTVLSVDQDKYLPAYTLNYTVPNVIPKTIVDGGVIEVYYKQSVFTVTYVKGEYGGFDVEVYGGLYYGDVTPVFAGDVGVTSEVGWRFNGWSPMVASTVTGDVTYVAQWSVWDDISYTVHYYLVDTSSSVVLDKVVFGQVFGTLITEYAIDVVGYSALAPVSLSVILGISDNDFVFYYTVNPSIGDNNVGSNKPSYTFVPCVPAVSEDKFEEVAPESTVPVVSFKEQSVYWALLNLIISMVGIILVVVLSVFVLLWHNKKQKHDKEPQNVQNNVKTQNTMKQSNNSDVDYVEMMSMGEGKQKRKQHRVLLYFTALVMGVVGVVVFLFTEDMSHSRVWVDNWTVVNVLIFIVEVIAIVFTFKTKKVNKKEEDYEGKKGN